MGKVCIFNPLSLVLASSLWISQIEALGMHGQVPAGGPDPMTRDLVTETLIRGLGATEVRPVPATAPACLLIAGVQGEDGTLVVKTGARLLTVPGDIRRDTMRELSVKFGASGLKVGQQLVMLTSDLEWSHQQKGEVLVLGFERGVFNGFFGGAPHVKDLVKVARWGNELCVAVGEPLPFSLSGWRAGLGLVSSNAP